MSDIRTYNDLLDEKKRLEDLLSSQKAIIRQDIAELREELRPALSLISTVGRIAKKTTSSPLLSAGVSFAADVFLKRGLLRQSGTLTQLLVPFLTKKVAGLVQNKGGNSIIGRIAGLFSKNGSKQ